MLLLFVFVVPAILFLITQQETLKAIQPSNREINPGSVWLQLFPIFGQVWQFIVVNKISISIRKEIESRLGDSILSNSTDRIDEINNRPTFKIGIAYCILFYAGGIINLTDHSWSVYAALIGPIFSFTGMACWIIYWVRLSHYKNKINKMAFKTIIPESV